MYTHGINFSCCFEDFQRHESSAKGLGEQSGMGRMSPGWSEAAQGEETLHENRQKVTAQDIAVCIIQQAAERGRYKKEI